VKKGRNMKRVLHRDPAHPPRAASCCPRVLVHLAFALSGVVPQQDFSRFPVVPDWVALVLASGVHQPLRIGMGSAFCSA
jgi:hypothetical protein